jgi:peptide/nickel transport system permease protein
MAFVGQALLTIFGVVLVSFFLLKMLPGDVVDSVMMAAGSANAEQMASMRERLGLNTSLLQQFLSHLGRLLHFDLGISTKYNTPVAFLILERIPATLSLVLLALVFAVCIGVVCGWVMSVFEGRWPDRILWATLLLSYSMPAFWLGLMTVVLFAVKLSLFPTGGSMTLGAGYVGWALLLDRAHHLVLPVSTLGMFYAAIYARLTRASMIEVQQQDFIRMARSKGLHPFTIQSRHALRNALLPITTMLGLHFGNILGGAIVVETVFDWPGLGRLALDSVMTRDFPIILGMLLFSSIVVVLANLLIDLLQMWIDPRIASR